DIRMAPMLRLYIAYDSAATRWLMMMLRHHLTGDHTTLEIIQDEIEAHLAGRANELPAPLPFRNLVGQARLGTTEKEHEAFFRQMLGDVDEPTAPFGLLNVYGDGTEINEARLVIDTTVGKRARTKARALGVSAASLFHLACGLVLARISGRSDVVF